MKAYIGVTAALFALLTLTHIWRGIVERPLASDPFFLITTVLSAGLCAWGARLLITGRQPR